MTLAKNIRTIRKNLSMTQKELARKVGIHKNYVGFIENGHRIPSVAMLEKIAKELNTTVSKLFCG
jgi:putative transcriptional regulator